MNGILIALAVLAMICVLVVLVIGLVGMIRGGEFNRKYGNKLMQARVVLQGAALALLALVFFLSQK
jgi:hypothetical protein